MSIFGNILNKILHHKPAAAAPAGLPPATAPTLAAPSAPALQPSAAANLGASVAPTAVEPVDIEAVLVEMASMKGGDGNWRTSIVDLLKLLDLDSSLKARKELAEELGVREGDDGSAEQNIALHKAVMVKLAQNGGVVPDSMRL